MKWQITIFRWVMALLLVAGSGYAVAWHMSDGTVGRYGRPEILPPPAGAPKALALVFPDPAAPERARASARRLAAQGALVAVVDTARYLDSVSKPGQVNCAGFADDAERFGKHLLRKRHIDVFLPPLLVGDGEGALLVRQAMAAAMPDVLAGGVVVDGGAAQDRFACGTQAPSAAQGTLAVVPASATADQLAQAVQAGFPAAGSGLAGLPLVEMHVPGSRRLAIVISGDGGWRELDKGVGAELNRQGVSVVGWNSLRYFWSKKSPQQIGDDLSRVMAEYQRRWHADDIALVGYSFGADVMPFAYQRLPEAQRRQVRFVSLLGLAHGANFKVRVGGWLGFGKSGQAPVLPELAKMDPRLLQCIHGEQEKGSLCPELEVRGIEVVARPGGHHFDHDPAKLAAIILQGWQRRVAGAAAAAHA
ncbi:AcvB/VirJ family lysyl-phosphatidylglycerol hydrolase [[Pseudomonas] boreopolis]|uniref:AcvB/VirJ family lysyl-phosphatidylglycerol hydrolase n=1 Tax=Xanthomonas boreopolis TaxID=86183 RepID=UPI003D9BA7A1